MAKVVIDRVGTIYVNEGEDKTLNVRLATTKGRVALVGANLLGLITASGDGRLEARPNAAGGRTWSYAHRKVVGEYDTEIFTHQKMKTDASVALTALKAALPAVESMTVWDMTALHDLLVAAAEQAGLKKGQMLWSFRIAITGRASTPGGATEMAALLGKEECVKRLKFSIDLLSK